MFRQGDIHLGDFPVSGRRPAVVVSRDALNRGNYVVIVTFTTARLAERRQLRNCVFFRAGEFGLDADCVAQCETISYVPKDIFDPTPLGRLDDLALRNLVNANGDVIGAECEPA